MIFDFVLIFTGLPSPGLLAGSPAAGGGASFELFDLVLVFVTPCDGVGAEPGLEAAGGVAASCVLAEALGALPSAAKAA